MLDKNYVRSSGFATVPDGLLRSRLSTVSWDVFVSMLLSSMRATHTAIR